MEGVTSRTRLAWAQLYNSRHHYGRLAEALGKELAAERVSR